MIAHAQPPLAPGYELVESEELELFEAQPVQVAAEPAPRRPRAAGPTAPFAPYFRDAENARTAAWRALDHGDRAAAAAHCHAAAAAFTQAAELAEQGGE